MWWWVWLVVGALLFSGVPTFILLTEGRYFGKPLVKWAYDRYGASMFPNRGNEATWTRLIHALELKGDERVLDLGTSTGAFPLRVAARRGFNGTAYGIDWSGVLINEAREEAERRGLAEKAQFLVGDARNPLPFSDAFFDVSVCLGVLEGLPHPETTLAELDRVLKPGGTLVVSHYRPHPITPTLSAEWYSARLRGYSLETIHFRQSHRALLFTKPASA